jgi:hypothetical protein
MDRHPISLSSLLELPPDVSEFVEPSAVTSATAPSAKIRELVKLLKVFGSDEKTLVFSQFTSFLDRVAGALEKEGVVYCRFDGSMPAKRVSRRICEHDTGNADDRTATRGDCKISNASNRGWSQVQPGRHAHLAQKRCCGAEFDGCV